MARARILERTKAIARARKKIGQGYGQGNGQVQDQEKGAKNKKDTERCKKKPKTRIKDDYVKRAKNRLKAMQTGNNNGMGEGKQEQNKGDIRTMT